MDRKLNRMQQWLDTAVGGIRFGPDRKAVREELCAHLEDKTADFQRIFPDISPEGAEARAVEEMGDAEILRADLAKIHKPWLGYLWTASRVLAVPTVVLAVGYLLVLLVFAPILWLVGGWEYREAIVPLPDGQEDVELVLEPEKDGVWISGCWLTMEEAWLTRTDEGPSLTVRFRVLSPCIWVEEWTFFRQLTARDSLGNVWRSQREQALAGAQPSDERAVQGAGGAQGDYLLSLPHLFTSRVQIQLPQIDREAEWIRLEYDWQGRAFSMALSWKEDGE